MKKRTIFLQIVGLSIAYYFTARWGLKIGAVSVFATLIWPPTGIALAALILLGYRVWPGIFLAAFVVNFTTGAPVLAAFGMATGNTLEAFVGAYFLRRLNFNYSLSRVRDVFSLVILAAFASTAVSASIGVGSLYLSGVVSRETFYPTWLAWWFGDMLGDLLIAPFLFVWRSGFSFKNVPLTRYFDVVILMSVVFAGCLLVFRGDSINQPHLLQQPYLVFPLLILVAVQLDQRWSITAVLMTAIMVIWITASGNGSFWENNLSESLLRAQVFVAVLAISKMVLAATVMERKAREHEAQDALQTRDEFLSIASHELKTPLTSLKLQLQLLSRELTEPKSLKNAKSAEQQVRRLSLLLDDLLDLTRIRAGHLKLAKEKVDLCTVVEDVAKRMESTNTAPIRVTFSNRVVGEWDRVRIEQVATNLISNALKYGNASPIAISIESDGAQAKLSVADQGPGIPPGMLEKIFERFHRGGVDSYHISGLGLGLYICRQIIEAHNGTITVESETNKGAQFLVQLPIASV
jgi:signal transduction histidine kinase